MPFGKFKGTKIRNLDAAYVANLLEVGMLNDGAIDVLKLALMKKVNLNPFSTDFIDSDLKQSIENIDFKNNVGLLAFKHLNESQINWLLVQFEAIFNAKIESL